jgi:single-stranded-DNA-specific exonuclease
VVSQRLLKDRHLKLDLMLGKRRIAGIIFGHTEPLGPQATLAYQLQRDDWQGANGVSLIVQHVGGTD